MKKILALDFDGVICDSIKECMLVSYYAYNNELSHPKLDISIINPTLQKKFKKYRYLVGPAKNYYFLWKILLDKSSSNIERGYHRIKKNKAGMEKKFIERFYDLREEVRTKEFDKWVSFNPFYPKMNEFLNSTININNLYIVTTKDAQSVFDLLHINNIKINKKKINITIMGNIYNI